MISRRVFLGAIPAWALAADFWNGKRYSTWDAGEVERMLTASPWAQTVPLKTGGSVVVRWASAAPVQMAIARRDQGNLTLPSAPRRWNAYVITVSGDAIQGLPSKPREARDALMEAATLRPRGRAPLQPEAVEARTHEVEFRFPNDEAITSKVSTVDFAMRLGKTAVRTRFVTADMMFDGELAL